MPLFNFATPNKFRVLEVKDVNDYLPTIRKSVKFSHKTCTAYQSQYGTTVINTENWSSLNLFEAVNCNENTVIFCGTGIRCMEWVPLPDNFIESQWLAVYCKRNSSEEVRLNNFTATKCIIQLWCINKLSNVNGKNHIPKLAYSIGLEYGPILHMTFCPSGGFTDDRIGLLAVPSISGTINVLALPRNLTCDNSSQHPILDIQPSLILCCNLSDNSGSQVSRLSWSKVNSSL